MFPSVGVALPRLVTGLVWPRHRVGSPQRSAGVGIESIDMGAGALVAAAAADDELVVDHKWSRGQRAMGFLEIVEYDALDELARIGLGPQDLAIARDGNDKILVQRDATVRGNHEIGLIGARIIIQAILALAGSLTSIR